MAKTKKETKQAGYKTEDLISECLDVIRKYNLIFFDDIPAYVPFSRATMFNHGLNELDDIKNALSTNRVRTKNSLRKKWHDSDNPTTQIALYKLVGTDDERKLLSTSYQHQTVKQEQPFFPDVPADDSDQSVTDSE